MKVFDVFPFFNELDLLEIRLNILNPYVDYFVLSESTKTFSGLDKPLFYEENKERFAEFNHKIIHNIVDQDAWSRRPGRQSTPFRTAPAKSCCPAAARASGGDMAGLQAWVRGDDYGHL